MDHLKEIRELRVEPSNQIWELEIYRVLNGERESLVLRLGSAEEYIESQLRASVDPTKARVYFLHALRNVIQEWNVSPVASEDFLKTLLDLVITYRPVGASSKILEFMRNLEPIEETCEFKPEAKRLLRRALIALERYFPAPLSPAEADSQAFKAYINILRLDLRSTALSAYATRRLIELVGFELPQTQISAMMEFYTIESLVAVALDPDPPVAAAQILGSLCIYCIESGLRHQFEDALINHGGTISTYGKGIRILFDERETIYLGLPIEHTEHALQAFMVTRWTLAGNQGFEKLREVEQVEFMST
jgi:hypothetical protein